LIKVERLSDKPAAFNKSMVLTRNHRGEGRQCRPPNQRWNLRRTDCRRRRTCIRPVWTCARRRRLCTLKRTQDRARTDRGERPSKQNKASGKVAGNNSLSVTPGNTLSALHGKLCGSVNLWNAGMMLTHEIIIARQFKQCEIFDLKFPCFVKLRDKDQPTLGKRMRMAVARSQIANTCG